MLCLKLQKLIMAARSFWRGDGNSVRRQRRFREKERNVEATETPGAWPHAFPTIVHRFCRKRSVGNPNVGRRAVPAADVRTLPSFTRPSIKHSPWADVQTLPWYGVTIFIMQKHNNLYRIGRSVRIGHWIPFQLREEGTSFRRRTLPLFPARLNGSNLPTKGYYLYCLCGNPCRSRANAQQRGDTA
jgi:hypothetical protein